jgi:cytochrome c556
MLRKWITLATVMTAFTVVFAAVSWANDDASPLHKLMEEVVNKKNAAIAKVLRSKTAYQKDQKPDQKKAAAAAELLAKAAKESQKDTSAVTKQKKTVEEWNTLSDEFIKTSAKLADVLGKGDATLDQAKKAHAPVKASCTKCHEVFRIEDK